MRKTKKVKQINLPMKFNPGLSKFEPELPVRKINPGLSKFEPELPVRKINVRVETKRNWWAFWYIIILIIILAIEISYLLLKKLFVS